MLSEKYRKIVVLRYYHNYESFTEIGEELGIKPGTARQHNLRALKKMKEILEKDAYIMNKYGL